MAPVDFEIQNLSADTFLAPAPTEFSGDRAPVRKNLRVGLLNPGGVPARAALERMTARTAIGDS